MPPFGMFWPQCYRFYETLRVSVLIVTMVIYVYIYEGRWEDLGLLLSGCYYRYHILYKSGGGVREGVTLNNVVLLTTSFNFTWSYLVVFHSRLFMFMFMSCSSMTVIILLVFFVLKFVLMNCVLFGNFPLSVSVQLSLSVCLSVCPSLPLCLSVCLSVFFVSVHISFALISKPKVKKLYKILAFLQFLIKHSRSQYEADIL